MNLEEFRGLCMSFYKAEENAPWSDPRYQNLLTFTVDGKWFCLIDIDTKCCNIKCPPEQVAELQELYRGIEPACHMNKKHWVMLRLDSDVPDSKIRELLRQAYGLIVKKLSRARREALGLRDESK